MMLSQNPLVPGYDLGYDIIASADVDVFQERVARYAIRYNL